MRQTISACMIVKNEEAMLRECLETIHYWVDEIIVVDTGSTDKTKEIAAEFDNVKIFDHPWQDDFSEARNFSIAQATMDWVLIIDADERFNSDDIGQFLSAIANNMGDGLRIQVFNVTPGVDGSTFLQSVRAWRRDSGIVYERRVHNVVEIPDGLIIAQIDAKIAHLGYGLSPEKMQAKFKRTRDLLLKAIETDPNEPMEYFYMAQNSYFSMLFDDTIAYAKKCIAMLAEQGKDWVSVRLMCKVFIAFCLHFQKNYETAIVVAKEALEEKPDYLDAQFCIAQSLVGQERYEDAIEAYKQYIHCADMFNPLEQQNNIIMLHTSERAHSCTAISKIYGLLGNRWEQSRWAGYIEKYAAIEKNKEVK